MDQSETKMKSYPHTCDETSLRWTQIGQKTNVAGPIYDDVCFPVGSFK